MTKDERGEWSCRWCDEVDQLSRRVKSLEVAIEGKCIKLEPGDYNLMADTIGLLEVNGGTVTFATPPDGFVFDRD